MTNAQNTDYALAKRADAYAAKWRAEHERAEPPVCETPTDKALSRCFANCARVPSPEMYDAIRAEIQAQNDSSGSQA